VLRHFDFVHLFLPSLTTVGSGGINENYNRLLRQYFPKKTSFENITEKELKAVQDKLNHRERKRLGFLSPIQYLHSLLLTKVAFAT